MGLLKKSLELQRAQFNAAHSRAQNLTIPPLQYSPSAQPVTSSQFLSSHQPRPMYSMGGLLSQMNQLREKQMELKRKQREIEDQQSHLIQHMYQITASINESRFDSLSKEFSRDPKKRRLTPPSYGFYH